MSGSTGRYELRRRRAKISGCLQGSTVNRGLAKPGFVDGTAQDTDSLLIRVESHRVFGFDKVRQELGTALIPLGDGYAGVRRVSFDGEGNGAGQIEYGVDRHIPHLIGPVLDAVDALPEVVFGPRVARLAGIVDVQHGAAHPVVAHLHGPYPDVRHVAVGARDATLRVDALVVELEFGVLRLEGRCAAGSVDPIPEAGFLIISEDGIGAEAFRPGVDEQLFRSLEVVLDVTLPAYVGSHLEAGGVSIDVIIFDAVERLDLPDAIDEGGPCDAQGHRFRIVAVNTRYGVLDELDCFAVGHLVHPLEACHEVAVAELDVRAVDRRMAVEARSGLTGHDLALGKHLIDEHVSVAALLAEVLREGVPRPEVPQPRVLDEPRSRDFFPGIKIGRLLGECLTSTVPRTRHIHRPPVEVVLDGEVFAPGGRIARGVGKLDDAIEGVPSLPLAFHDVRQQSQHPDAGQGDQHDQYRPPVALPEGARPIGSGLIYCHTSLPIDEVRSVSADHMSHRIVTARAGYRFGFGGFSVCKTGQVETRRDRRDDVLMTLAAGVFCDFQVVRLYP